MLFYSMYSSSRNDGDGAAERTSGKVTESSPQPTTQDVTAQRQQSAQTISGIGSQTSLKLYADSRRELVNTVQAIVTYPSDALQYVSLSNGTAFTREFATDTTVPGKIKLVRTVPSQSASVKGQHLVATLTFKKLKEVDPSAVVLVDVSDSFLVTSKDNQNLLNTSGGTLTLRK
jgi:transcriptional regulator of heat shock response